MEGKDTREPLLPDYEVELMESVGAPKTVRDFYERLIDEGKLRVVDEVDYEERESFVHCSGCGLSFPWEADAWIGTMNFCPGCGNRIKR